MKELNLFLNIIKNEDGSRFTDVYVGTESGYLMPEAIDFKIGLPKLPPNFPPVAQDLNDLIAQRKGISVSAAFDLDRDALVHGCGAIQVSELLSKSPSHTHKNIYNALWDAEVTKLIYNNWLV